MNQSPIVESKDEVMAIVKGAIEKRKQDPHQLYHLLIQPRKRKHPSVTANSSKVSKFWMDFVGTEAALLHKMQNISKDLSSLSPNHYFDINAYLPPVGKEDSLWHMYSYAEGNLVRH